MLLCGACFSLPDFTVETKAGRNALAHADVPALLQAPRQVAGQNLCLVRQPLGSGEIRFARILGLLHEILNMAHCVLLFVAQIPAAD